MQFRQVNSVSRRRPRGFALVELAASLIIVTLLAAVLIALATEPRRHSSLGDNLANLKQFASATSAYAADNDDRIWTFTWQPGVNYGFGGIASTPAQAAANQAIDIIRRRGNRPDIAVISGWFPHVNWSHLVLLDYLETWQPERFVAAPEDRLRILWQTSIVLDPSGFFDLLPDIERPSGNSNAEKRWPYSSSYERPPAFISPDARSQFPTQNTLSQGSTHNSYFIPSGLALGDRRLAEIRHPSQKVMLFESYQRHFGPGAPYFAYPAARVPLLLADGGIAVRRTAEAGRGFQPNSPRTTSATIFSYAPAGWEPPTLSGFPSELVTGHYRWTRSGLRGRDFGGPEIPWVD